MPRRRPSQRTKSKPRPVDRNDSKLKRWNTLADVELDEEDQFHASRDRILLDGGDNVDDDDEEEEVFALRGVSDSDDDGDPDEVEDDLENDDMQVDSDAHTVSKSKLESSKAVRDTKKALLKDASDSEEEETWGRSKSAYYSSNAVELDSEDEDANELEEQEALRLQAKACEGLCDEDFGLGDVVEGDAELSEETEHGVLPIRPPAKVPQDKQSVLHSLEIESPETLALARDWDDTAHNLVEAKSRIEALKSSEVDMLELGLQHLHYQALLTYATTLAFYLHLRATDKYAARPHLLRRHPILSRLLSLKQGIATIESLGIGKDVSDADSDSEEEAEEEEEEEDDLSDQTDGDLWSLIKHQGLETGELAGLLEDAAQFSSPPRPSKLKKKSKPAFDLVEPAYRARRTKAQVDVVEDPYGEVTALEYPDMSDKQARKKSLRFHVSRIASSSARRTKARTNAVGGDDDIPYRERKKEREMRLEKEAERKRANGQLGEGGDDLDDVDPEVSTKEKKRKRRRAAEDEDAEDDAIGYYDLVKQASTIKKARKKAEYEAATARPELEPEDTSGPRSVTRAILKNKGLTPHRSKVVRNPRVKKRQKFEQVKKKVASQKAVYKGGIGDVSRYSGEQSGISKVVKSVRL